MSKDLSHRLGLAYAFTFICLCLLYTILKGVWPEILIFDADSSLSIIKKLQTSPIHLSDDVMISLRSGNTLKEIGIPALNHKDLAQPSTSYLAPYSFATTRLLLPPNLSVMMYSLVGFLCVFFTFSSIYLNANSKLNSLCAIALISLTSTNLEYALNGWDHLFQALFLCLAAAIALKPISNTSSLIKLGLYSSLAILFRPDGLFLSTALLVAAYRSIKCKKIFLYSIAPFAAVILVALSINYFQFETLTPTTSRLKLGASPSLEYSWNYFYENSFLDYSAITTLLIFLVFYTVFRKLDANKAGDAIFFGCVLSAILYFYNSDIFIGGRMYWASTCIMAVALSTYFPPIFSKKYIEIKFEWYAKCILLIMSLVLIFFAIQSIPNLVRQKLSNSLITKEKFYTSAIPQQYLIAKWINTNLNPKDGSIGLFYLGISYYLPNFEVADFLGKGDELIATSPVKWGPPGHNKWDIDKTIAKWNPQAIIPANNVDKSISGALKAAKDASASKAFWGFNADLVLNETIHSRFKYCYLNPQSTNTPIDKFGFLLRNDIVISHKNQLICN